MPRNTFGPKRHETRGGWDEWHNMEIHHLYSSRNISLIKSTRMRCAGLIARMYTVLVWKPEDKIPFRGQT